jgi:hypothetical protein
MRLVRNVMCVRTRVMSSSNRSAVCHSVQAIGCYNIYPIPWASSGLIPDLNQLVRTGGESPCPGGLVLHGDQRPLLVLKSELLDVSYQES